MPIWKFPGKDEFIKVFAEAWNFFQWVNTGFCKIKRRGRKKRDQSNTLAMLLQRIEATVMFDYIIPRIESELKGLPIWTIHDSVMTDKGEEEAVARIIREEAAKVIGMPPKVDFEQQNN